MRSCVFQLKRSYSLLDPENIYLNPSLVIYKGLLVLLFTVWTNLPPMQEGIPYVLKHINMYLLAGEQILPFPYFYSY